MRILLTNDDGVDSTGLAAMRRALNALGEVTVVAPASGQSACGHAITIGDAVIADRVHVDGGFPVYSVVGRPADCVKIAVHEILDGKPDLVVSGINAGANVGVNVLYSGTVAAAIEATFYGLPAVAVSLDEPTESDYDRAADVARRIIEQFLQVGLEPGWLMNVNIPCLAEGPPRGVRVVRQSPQRMYERFFQSEDPYGRTYYWLTGGWDEAGMPETDLHAVSEGYVAVTPLRFDLTRDDALDALRQWQWPAIHEDPSDS